MIIVQMLIALSVVQVDLSVLVTLVFAVLPILLGLLIIRRGAREKFELRTRILIGVFGLLGFVTWSGLLVGPILTIFSSIMPEKRMRRGR
jgi:hypothetical protein